MNREEFFDKLDEAAEFYSDAGETSRTNMREMLDNALDDLSCNDFFGTEGQNDPRGDQRNAEDEDYKVKDRGFLKTINAFKRYLRDNEDEDVIDSIKEEFEEMFNYVEEN